MTDTPANAADTGAADGAPTADPRPLPVLVVGSGPVGLTVAAELLRRGVDVRLVDRAEKASPRTKALLVWPRTLDVLRELGGAKAIEDGALPVDCFRYYSSARLTARIGFDTLTRPVVLPQPAVESLLFEALEETGGSVERGTVLVELTQTETGVRAGLEKAGAVTHHDFSYVVACDGANSNARDMLGLEFVGETHPLTFMLADCRVEGPLQSDAIHYYCSPRGVLVMVALPDGRFRVFTSAPPGLKREDATLELFQEMVDQRGPGGLRLYDADWTSTFPVHARHAERFRTGRIFLAGDAAHIHSPAGGQGLNTGVTDAHNLAWKLALVWHGHAGDALLDSYQSERREVAGAVVRQADLQTAAWLIKQPWKVALRDAAAWTASKTRLFNRDYVPWLTGLRTSYRDGAVIPDGTRRPGRAGERRFVPGALLPVRLLADTDTVGGGLHHTLLVVPGRKDAAPVAATGLLPAVSRVAEADLVRVRAVADRKPGPEQRGDEAVAALRAVPAGSLLVLVRPDGHVAAVGRPDATDDLTGYLNRYLRSDQPRHTEEPARSEEYSVSGT